MDLLLEPNVAYLLLMVGFWLSLLALLTPGTGFFEIAALFAMLWAGWSILNIGVNWWALGVLVLGVFPALIAARATQRNIFMVISITALIVGTAFLIRGEGWRPAVDLVLLLIVSPISAGYYWVMMHKILEAVQAKPSHDLEQLIGQTGEARTDISQEGTVYVDGELWSATSAQPIQQGKRVRVSGRDGFTLLVEPTHSVDGDSQAT